ncbi:LPS O-antigen chain length determinant protein WzzB [Desulfobulbus propionicus]
MSNTPNPYQNDEIDLRELAATLWKGKLLILAITALFSIAGIAYALLARQEWSSKAVVTAPMPAQVKQLRLRLENIKAVNPKDDSSMDKFFTAFSEANLFTDFIEAFKSFDNKSEFLKTHGYVPEADKINAGSRQSFLEKTAKKIIASQKKQETFYTLSVVADNAPEARKWLSAYLNFLQTREVAIKNQQLKVEIANQSQSLAFKHQILKVDTLKRLNEEITRTEFALRISKTAGVETPVENLNNQTIFPIDLGAKALSEKLNVLKEIKDPEIINPELADIRLRLDGLQAVPMASVSFTSYHLLQSPTEPLSRDKPKRSLLVVLATVAGLLVGMMTALFRSYLLSPAGARPPQE